jgi:long-chain fatty acid transport protein
LLKLSFPSPAPQIVRVIVLWAVLTTVPCASRAGGALTWFGNDARTAAMGGTGSSTGAGGPSQLLVNPALMSFHGRGVWATFSVCPSWMKIRLKDRSAGYDVPESIYSSDPLDWGLDRPVPTSLLTNGRSDTEDLDPAMLLTIAAIGSLFHKDLRVGLGFTTPLPGLMTVSSWYNDEREQHFSNELHFERFGEFDSAMSFYPGLSFAPVRWFSAGMTLQIDLAMALKSRIFLTESTTWDYAYLDTSGEVTPLLRPIAGVAFRTPVGLGFGAVYRHESYADVGVDIDIRVWNGERVDEATGAIIKQWAQHHRNVFGYKPREVALSASFERKRLSVEATGTLELWSGYLDRHGNDWTHPTASDTAGDAAAVAWEDPTFDNVFSARVGAELRASEHVAVRAGGAYFPSPMPSQTGRYNYVDNDLLMYSAGVGIRFRALGRTMTADLAAQLWQMLELEVLKSRLGDANGGIVDEVADSITDIDDVPVAEGLQTNNPGFPGYDFGGFALNIALTLGVELD